MNLRALPLFVSAALAATTLVRAADDVKLTSEKDRIRVEIGGQLFTEYVYGDGASRPYCYPVLAPDGTGMTRDFPQKNTPGEETDHRWHRAVFFAHSFMNGVDFWNEKGGDVGKSPATKGNQVHEQLVEVKSGKVGSLHTRSRWLDPDGKLICTDDRVLRFGGDAQGRYIDYEITLHALPDTPLLMGDNKDGTMAVRVAQWITMLRKNAKSGKEVGGSGHIVDAKGFRDDDVWGKRSEWATFYANKDGKTYGISIMEHPQNLRFPSWWMARGYGLFGKNPFGQRDYETTKEKPITEPIGNYTIPAGGSLALKYRLYFHFGDEKAARIAERYADYVAGK
jgi:hypothetical protein